MSDTVTGLSQAQRMMELFSGFEGAHGTHGAVQQKQGGPKHEIKKSARTIHEPVTEELWQQHLAGDRPLGVIPIRRDHTCRWGCIDVDAYDVSHAEIARQIEERQLPLILAKSKSGGAHIFLFMRDPQTAIDVRSLLHAVAASLGYGGSEIFPKQTEVLSEKGDMGNWLNMPYLGGDETTRYAVKRAGTAMTLDEFLETAEASAVDQAAFDKLVAVRPADRARPPGTSARRRGTLGTPPGDENAPPLSDGPPCLEHLAEAGFGEGMRNNGLFALGIYCQKRYGDDWENKLEEFNQAFMTPALPAEEVITVKRSLKKSQYNYACKQQPLSGHCNQALCRTRRHGISSSGDYPVITSLSVLDTDPPLWFLDVEDCRIEVSTEDLLNYRAFTLLCMARLHKVFRPLKQETWVNQISAAMTNLVVIEAPPEVSRQGHFRELLQEFLTNRQRGRKQDDLLSGRPWEDESAGRHYFRLKDLQSYLEREGIKNLTRGQITTRIKDLGGGSKFFNIKGKGVSTWFIPTTQVDEMIPVETPELPKEVM